MRPRFQIFVSLSLATWLLAARAYAPAQPAQSKGAEHLRGLVVAAQEKRGWPALRHFAESATDAEQRAEAFFALGYLEFIANDYPAAVEDLKKAASVDFPLADYAEYYEAAAADEAKEPNTAIDILGGFAFRHPRSVLRYDALGHLAEALLATSQPERAIQALTADPVVRQRPHLASLLGQAYERAGKSEEAARSFQVVYYSFPTSPDAHAAGEALEKLRAELGASRYPAVTEEQETARVETLLERGRTREALNEFGELLKKSPSSPSAPRWKVGRARCLLRLKQVAPALDELEKSFAANPDADAMRLDVLVDAYIQRDNRGSMDVILEQLRSLYPHSPSYASALDSAGQHLVRKGDWQSAARYYGPLAESFPDTQLGQEASWRVGWSYYLQHDSAKARKAFADHATRYPASARVAADFFWLGRLAEADGNTAEAQAFYALVEQRWTLTYYALAATQRLGAMKIGATAQDQPGANSLATELAQKIPPPTSPVDTCPPAPALPILRPFTTLAALGLDDLALQNLRGLIRERPSSPQLYLALSRFEAEKGAYNPSVLDAGRALPLYASYSFAELPRETWTLLFPSVYWTLVEQEAKARGIDPYLVMGLIRQESAFDPEARSIANARGLMQLLPRTARTRKSGRGSNARRLYEPEFNVKVGTEYLQQLLDLNHGVFEETMAAYHAGQERVNTWQTQHTFSDPAEFLETIPIPATRVYVEKVVRDAAIYRKLMTSSPAFKKCG